MSFYQYPILIFIGISSGIAVAGGLFAFITMIGVVTRLSVRTRTNSYIHLYEDMVILGGGLGNIIYLIRPSLPLGNIALLIFGLAAGVFAGCLSLALAEALNVFPILIKRTKLKTGFVFVIVSFAAGKAIGAFYQLCMQ